MAFGAVSVAGLLRLAATLPLAERSGQAFYRPTFLVEELTQALVLRGQFGVLPPQLTTSLTEASVHAVS